MVLFEWRFQVVFHSCFLKKGPNNKGDFYSFFPSVVPAHWFSDLVQPWLGRCSGLLLCFPANLFLGSCLAFQGARLSFLAIFFGQLHWCLVFSCLSFFWRFSFGFWRVVCSCEGFIFLLIYCWCLSLVFEAQIFLLS